MRINPAKTVWLGVGLVLFAWFASNIFVFEGLRVWEPGAGRQVHPLVVIGLSLLAIYRSVRFRGSFEDRVQHAILITFTIFGTYALVVLLGRLFFSRTLLLTTVPTVLMVSLALIWLDTRRGGVDVVILGPLVADIPPPLLGVDVVNDPDTDFRRYDIALVDLHAPVSGEWSQALSRAMLCGCRVQHVWDHLEELSGAVSLEHFELDHVPSVEADPYVLVKRGIDIVAATLLLPIVVPIIVIAGLFILLTSGGPIFFVQERAGLGGEPFRMWKLRTMRPLKQGEAEAAASLANARITRVGSILRRLRIDELPQLLNVLKGDMSLIGPRPEAMAFHRDYTNVYPKFAYRCIVRPGISGWAQVNAPPSASADEAALKLRYDLYYVKRQSVGLDLQIAIRTLWTVLHGGGVK